MLVQYRQHSLWLITQHNHALVSGKLAYHWKHTPPLPFLLLLAISLHDLSWIEADQSLHWSEDTPSQFFEYPLPQRLELYQKGVQKALQISPYLALLTSMHYQSFFDEKTTPHFHQQQQTFQQHWQKQLNLPQPHLQNDLKVLKFFDNLSLYLCYTPPAAIKPKLPLWMRPEIVYNLSPTPFQMHWKNNHELHFHPFPFQQEFLLTIPYQEITYQQLQQWQNLPPHQRNQNFQQTPQQLWRVWIKKSPNPTS